MNDRARRASWAGSHGLAACAGVLYALGFPGIGLWPLSLVFAWPLWWLLDGPSFGARRALSLGLTFGFVTHAIGYYWLPPTLVRFADLGWPAALAVSAALLLYQGGQLALWFVACWRARRLGRDPVVVAPVALAALELAYPLLFPSYLANSVQRLWPLAQLAELGGPTLVSALWLTASAALWASIVRRRSVPPRSRRAAALALSACVLAAGWGVARGRELEAAAARAPKRTLGLVQGNVGLDEKAVDEAGSVARHVALSRTLAAAHAVDLLVWPETVLQRPVARAETQLRARLPRLPVPLLTGALAWGREGDRPILTNSALLLDARGRVLGRYDKQRLLPFAEYLPLERSLPWLRRLAPATGRLSRGDAAGPLRLGGARLAVLICYEDVLPGLVRRAVEDGRPQLLVNLTNDAWFGDTTQPYIHLALAQLRAIEERRYLVRATNSGVSAVIDPLGRVIAETRTFEPATLAVEVALLSHATLYRALGDWPGVLALLALLALLGRGPTRGSDSATVRDRLP